MALFDTTWYVHAGDQSTTGYYAIAKWAASHAYTPGTLIRQNTAPAVGSERVFICIANTGDTLSGGTEPTWTVTRGAKNTDNHVTWQECTGAAAVNGDTTNTPAWAANTVYTLGQIIKRVNAASYWICSTAGTSGGSEPAWADNNAGTTRTDNTVTWTCLGVVGNFSAWGAPHARMANAAASTWFASGNTVYVNSASAESQSTAITITYTTALPSFGKILCVNSTSLPPVAADITTGATVSTTGASVNLNVTGTNFYMYGIQFKAGNGVASGLNHIFLQPSGGSKAIFDHCSFQLLNTTANNASSISLGTTTTGDIVWNACTIKMSTTSNFIGPGSYIWRWQNTGTILESGSSVPTNFLKFGANVASNMIVIVLDSLDLSQLSGSFDSFNANSNMGAVYISDCKLHASMSVTQPSCPGLTFQFVRSDSSGTAYKSSRYEYEGTESTETSITRVGGAQDPAGQAQSRKIVTTANTQFVDPFKATPIAIWNNTTGANVTVTIYGTINSASLPNDDEFWAECEYLGTASFPTGVIITSAKATYLTSGGAAGVNATITTDTSTWNGGGSGAGWTPFKIQFLLNTTNNPQPQFAGYIQIRVKVGKASTTYYLDPQIVLS